MIFSAYEKLRAIQREIGWRKKVYPNRVLTGRMKQREADWEIRIMEAIEQDYDVEVKKERLL